MLRLRIGDRLLRVRDEGESKRTPLVCVHGAAASSVVWMDTVRRIAPKRRVLAPDLPGHGQSDRWHEMADVSVAMYRDAVGTMCAQLGIDRVVLLGHSLGALVAIDCASAWPERVAGLFLVGGAAQLSVPPEVFDMIDNNFRRIYKWLVPLVWSPSTPRDLIERWGTLITTAPQDVARADFSAADAFDATPLLPKVRCPTLALVGMDDQLTPPHLTESLVAALANAEAVTLPRAGHAAMLEQPEAFFSHLERFLAILP